MVNIITAPPISGVLAPVAADAVATVVPVENQAALVPSFCSRSWLPLPTGNVIDAAVPVTANTVLPIGVNGWNIDI
jgi:hypothetical protein